MKITLISTIITVAGLIFTVFSLLIVFLGKKVGEKEKGPQKIKIGKYVEVNTNSVIMLVLIMVFLSIAPLGFTYWKPELSNYIEKSEVEKKFMPLKDLSLQIYGAVVLDDGSWAKNVKIEVIRDYKHKADTLVERTGEQGEFFIELNQAKPEERYSIIWSLKGYSSKKLSFGFNNYPFPLKLSKIGEN